MNIPHELNKNMNIKELTEIITQGKVSVTKITVPEGWNLKEIADELEKKKVVNKEDFLNAAAKSYDYPSLKDKPTEVSIEGYLFPDTYFFPANVTAETVVKNMLSNFENKVDRKILEKGKLQGYTTHEILTIASIIEKEVSEESDRAIVAGLLYKRLNNGIALEVDATINFITGKNNPQSSLEDLAIDSLYNTYKYKGLPPGPISNPGLAAIKAAVNPQNSDYWYYLNRQDTKETIFSKNFEEHLANKEKYLR